MTAEIEREVGDAAGMIWRHLDEHGATTLTSLKAVTGLSDPIVLMAIGWLTREGKLTVARKARTLSVALKSE